MAKEPIEARAHMEKGPGKPRGQGQDEAKAPPQLGGSREPRTPGHIYIYAYSNGNQTINTDDTNNCNNDGR